MWRNSCHLIYPLGETLGEFFVTVRNPNATFSVRSLTTGIGIGNIEAFDVKGEVLLSVELLGRVYPRVDVKNESSPSVPTAALTFPLARGWKNLIPLL